MSRQSRVPDLNDSQAHVQFLDAVDRRQLTLAQLEDLDSGAALADVIAKVNAILQSHRTK